MSYLFSRTARFAPGNEGEMLGWAAKVTEKVNSVGDQEYRLWTRMFGPGIGTVAWTTVVDEIAALTTNVEKLTADSSYVSLAAEGAAYIDGDGVNDVLMNLIHMDLDGVDTAQYAMLTSSVVAPGQTAAAVALGVEICSTAKAVTGRPMSFGASVTGPFGEVGWIALSDTIEQLQAANEALAADAGWIDLVDTKASETFVRSASERMITRRVV